MKILAHLSLHVGKLTPTNDEIADIFGCSPNTIDKHIAALKKSGLMFLSGSGSSRYFHFKGVDGHSLPRQGKVYGAPPALATYEPIDRPQACAWCGSRGCAKHGISRPSVSLVRSVAA